MDRRLPRSVGAPYAETRLLGLFDTDADDGLFTVYPTYHPV